MAANDNLHPGQFKLGKKAASVLGDIAAGGSESMAKVWGDDPITHVPMTPDAAKAIGQAWEAHQESYGYDRSEKAALAGVYTRVHHLDPGASDDHVNAAYRMVGKKRS